MPKSLDLCQLVARALSHTTWNIPRIRDGDRSSASHRDNNFFPPAEIIPTVLSQVSDTVQPVHPLTCLPVSSETVTQWRLLKG